MMKKYLFLLIMAGFTLTSCATRVVATAPTTNVVYIKKAPRNHTIVRIKGKRYYKWNGKHYRKTRRGFVFVRV